MAATACPNIRQIFQVTSTGQLHAINDNYVCALRCRAYGLYLQHVVIRNAL